MAAIQKIYDDETREYCGCPGITAPNSYWQALDYNPKMVEDITNDCGAKITKEQPKWLQFFYKVLRHFINTMWFLDVSPICSIHDWGYYIGEDERDRQHYDHMMMDNFIVWILHKTKLPILVWARNLRAMSFYTMVRAKGSDAFWEGKNN